MSDIQFNADEIRKAVHLLKPDRELFEVRIIRGQTVFSGYFREADTLIRELSKVNLARSNVYMTLQRLHEGCAARLQYECFMDSGREKIPTTSDADIVGYEFLPIDLDPVRPSGISSTDNELKAALEVRDRIAEYLADQGFDNPIYGFSGNGYHVLYRIFWDEKKEAQQNVKAVLNRLDELFSNDECHVDKTLDNPSRVLKLYGTYAQKGRSTADRPHRLSHLIGGDVLE